MEPVHVHAQRSSPTMVPDACVSCTPQKFWLCAVRRRRRRRRAAPRCARSIHTYETSRRRTLLRPRVNER
eukprot:1250114-Prymnesium_polylepis.1